MLRKNQKQRSLENINYLIHAAGIGDSICALIPAIYLYHHVPYINPLIWVPDYLVEFTKHVLPKKISVRGYTEAALKYNEKLTAISNDWTKGQTAMRRHPVDHAFHTMLDKHMPIEHKNYPKIRIDEINISKFNLPEKYIVIPVGATAKPKELSAEIINNISKYALIKGYTPVYLGKRESVTGYEYKKLKATLAPINYRLGIDLTEKTSILEAAAIMGKAKCVVGMEGGLTHLAACSEVPIIASFTFVSPELFSPIRNNEVGWNIHTIVPDEKLECRFCQSNLVLYYSWDFRDCIYSDYKCSVDLTFQQFKEKLDLIL